VSNSFTIELLIALYDQLGYWIWMRLSFKPNVTCRPVRNLWFVNVFSTFER